MRKVQREASLQCTAIVLDTEESNDDLAVAKYLVPYP